jgi:hypothetical protein
MCGYNFRKRLDLHINLAMPINSEDDSNYMLWKAMAAPTATETLSAADHAASEINRCRGSCKLAGF